jgi:hypothetical protein
MHENIKYTAVLDKKIKPVKNNKDLSIDTSIPSKEELADWQCIFADYVYGTHFFVYAKFIGTNSGSSFEVTKIQLYLQNYSGPVSLGFTSFINMSEMTMPREDPDNDDRPPTKKKYSLEFGLRGMNMGNNFIELDTSLLLNDHDIIVSEPIFSPINNSVTKIFDSLNHNLADYVDELFMARVGEDIVITEEGRARIEKLVAFGHFNGDEEKINDLLAKTKANKINSGNLSVLENKNIKWPCKPRNSSIRIIH